MNTESSYEWRKQLMWGLVLVCVGVTIFLAKMDYIEVDGLWLFAVFENLFGLTLRNSWPFVIIASGISMIIEPAVKRRFAPNEESGNEK